MVQDFNQFFGPCALDMVSVLEQLPGLMTPDQRRAKAQLLASFNKLVAMQRSAPTARK